MSCVFATQLHGESCPEYPNEKSTNRNCKDDRNVNAIGELSRCVVVVPDGDSNNVSFTSFFTATLPRIVVPLEHDEEPCFASNVCAF